MTEWCWTFSDGTVFRSQLQTLIYLKNNRHLKVCVQAPHTRGTIDVTEKYLKLLHDHPYGGASR